MTYSGWSLKCPPSASLHQQRHARVNPSRPIHDGELVQQVFPIEKERRLDRFHILIHNRVQQTPPSDDAALAAWSGLNSVTIIRELIADALCFHARIEAKIAIVVGKPGGQEISWSVGKAIPTYAFDGCLTRQQRTVIVPPGCQRVTVCRVRPALVSVAPDPPASDCETT